MRRNLSCPEDVERLNRGAWTAQEDKLLTSYIMVHGEGKWSHVPFRAGLNRSGKSCRLRWLNYLRPDIKRGNITQDEEDLIMRLHKLLGNRWSLIAGRLPGRTDNEIKNYWNTTLGKKLRTESGAGTSSQQKKHHTSSKSSDSDDVITTRLPHVIQTKALRCKNVFIQQHPPHCHEETSTINSPASDHLGFELAPQFLQDLEQKEEFKDELNAADFYREFNFDDSIMDDMVMDAQANEFSLIGNCETADDGCGNIGTMDLDLMTFLLDSSSGSGDGLNSF